MKSLALSAALFLVLPIMAQPPKTEPAKPEVKAPALNDNLQKRYFKATAELQVAMNQSRAASEAAQAKQAALSAVVKEVTAACGEKFEPQMDSDGDPACVAKPPAVKK